MASSDSEFEIEVFARDSHRGGDQRGNEKVRRQGIDKRKLASQMATFVKAVSEIIVETAEVAGEYGLEEVKLTAELTTEGKVILIGAEGSVTGRGAIEFTFRRRASTRSLQG